jgi:DNA-binding MarR family transcriptional regulator
MADSTIRASEIPDVFFTALALLLPYMNKIAQNECGIDVGSIFVMMHLVISGKKVDRRPTMLRNDLTKLLLDRGFSQAGASRLMQGLEESGFVERKFIPTAVREEVFEPSDRANTLVVVLKPEGEKKIDEFKAALRAHFGHWLSSELKKQNGTKKRGWLAVWVRKILRSEIARKLAKSLTEQIATA